MRVRLCCRPPDSPVQKTAVARQCEGRLPRKIGRSTNNNVEMKGKLENSGTRYIRRARGAAAAEAEARAMDERAGLIIGSD